MILKKADENIELLKELYKKAFPENERKPFELVLENEKKGIADILAIEDEQYDNNEQRTRRKAFYLRNGLKASGIHTKVYETDMELLIFDKPVSFEEYKDIFKLAIDEERLKIIGEPELI